MVRQAASLCSLCLLLFFSIYFPSIAIPTIIDSRVYSDEEGTEQEGLMEAHKRKQRQMLMQSEIATNEAIIAERETSMRAGCMLP